MNEYNLDKSKLVLDPFPHMIEDNFLSETLINNLVLNFLMRYLKVLIIIQREQT